MSDPISMDRQLNSRTWKEFDEFKRAKYCEADTKVEPLFSAADLSYLSTEDQISVSHIFRISNREIEDLEVDEHLTLSRFVSSSGSLVSALSKAKATKGGLSRDDISRDQVKLSRSQAYTDKVKRIHRDFPDTLKQVQKEFENSQEC